MGMLFFSTYGYSHIYTYVPIPEPYFIFVYAFKIEAKEARNTQYNIH